MDALSLYSVLLLLLLSASPETFPSVGVSSATAALPRCDSAGPTAPGVSLPTNALPHRESSAPNPLASVVTALPPPGGDSSASVVVSGGVSLVTTAQPPEDGDSSVTTPPEAFISVGATAAAGDSCVDSSPPEAFSGASLPTTTGGDSCGDSSATIFDGASSATPPPEAFISGGAATNAAGDSSATNPPQAFISDGTTSATILAAILPPRQSSTGCDSTTSVVVASTEVPLPPPDSSPLYRDDSTALPQAPAAPPAIGSVPALAPEVPLPAVVSAANVLSLIWLWAKKLAIGGFFAFIAWVVVVIAYSTDFHGKERSPEADNEPFDAPSKIWIPALVFLAIAIAFHV